LRQIPGIVLDPPAPDTNIVFWRLGDPALRAASFLAALRDEGVCAMELGKGRIRAVTHCGITPDDVSAAIRSIARVVDRLGAREPAGARVAQGEGA
jgi:threonine aldolase